MSVKRGSSARLPLIYLTENERQNVFDEAVRSLRENVKTSGKNASVMEIALEVFRDAYRFAFQDDSTSLLSYGHATAILKSLYEAAQQPDWDGTIAYAGLRMAPIVAIESSLNTFTQIEQATIRMAQRMQELYSHNGTSPLPRTQTEIARLGGQQGHAHSRRAR